MDGVLDCVCLCDGVITSNLLPPSGSLMGSQVSLASPDCPACILLETFILSVATLYGETEMASNVNIQIPVSVLHGTDRLLRILLKEHFFISEFTYFNVLQMRYWVAF